jgi:transcriptional/translational regulatory protein YebC/TACO1
VGSEDKVMEAAIEAGAEDVESDAEEGHTIYTAFEDLGPVADALEKILGAAKTTNLIWRPRTLTPVSGDQLQTLMKLMAGLEDDDDVQNVFVNFEASDEDMAKFADA